MIGTTACGTPARRVAALALAGALAAAALAPAAAQLPKKEDTFNLSAPYAILIDYESGSVLFEKNADQLMEPSSMAKLMTVEVVLQAIKEGRLKPDDEFIISEHAWRHGGAPSHGSTMYAPIHSMVRVIDLLQGAIIQSGNDACIALAEGMAGSEDAFAEIMTKRARELGLTKSNFANPTGLPDPRTHVTARELAKLAQHLIRTYPDYYHFFGEREFTWNRIRQLNRNPLLAANVGVDGLKTGFTREAGYGIVASAVQNRLRLIAVTNGFKDLKARGEETRKLLEWGFKGFESRPLFAEGQTIGDARLYGGARGRVPLVANGSVSLLVPRNSSEHVLARVVYTGPVRAPIEKGQQIGELKVWRGDNVVLEVPLQASEAVGRGSLSQRAFDAATELVINLFRAGVQKL
ncbi:MAG TPA: D-alanyl-D-alanine carboxypeptidase family protein [Xanthobacteraceae bacterium]|jgi:D-alanyl-D-alanine carboxypeptidase (penicillin-binding protein 5/6)|nr:D-alanyl-D-alanine carboxypeptidase family protein [Xanthobacteraceae bacterium]